MSYPRLPHDTPSSTTTSPIVSRSVGIFTLEPSPLSPYFLFGIPAFFLVLFCICAYRHVFPYHPGQYTQVRQPQELDEHVYPESDEQVSSSNEDSEEGRNREEPTDEELTQRVLEELGLDELALLERRRNEQRRNEERLNEQAQNEQASAEEGLNEQGQAPPPYQRKPDETEERETIFDQALQSDRTSERETVGGASPPRYSEAEHTALESSTAE